MSWLTPSRSLSLDLDLVRARHLLKCKIELKLDSFYFELATNFQIHFQEYQVKLQVRMPWYEYEPLLTYGCTRSRPGVQVDILILIVALIFMKIFMHIVLLFVL